MANPLHNRQFMNDAFVDKALKALLDIDEARADRHAQDYLSDAVVSSFLLNLRCKSDQKSAGLSQYIFHNFERSHAQLYQDLWVLFETDELVGGFFVEFGAANGRELSNTYLLEKSFGWQGVICEPNPSYIPEIRLVRDCQVFPVCVYPGTQRKIDFRCTEDGVFSTVKDHARSDFHFETQRSHNFVDIKVDTISLNDLLLKACAPRVIHYLSIDTEGSEYEIIADFPFDQWHVKLLSIEHNFTSSRQKINSLLTHRGFERTLDGFSRWEDWYVNTSVGG